MSYLPPSSFSYEARALEEAFWEAGAKAEALARREATRASFMVSVVWQLLGFEL